MLSEKGMGEMDKLIEYKRNLLPSYEVSKSLLLPGSIRYTI